MSHHPWHPSSSRDLNQVVTSSCWKLRLPVRGRHSLTFGSHHPLVRLISSENHEILKHYILYGKTIKYLKMGPSCPITTHTKYLLMEKSVDYVTSNALYLQGIASPDPLPGNSDTITLMNTFDTHINT